MSIASIYHGKQNTALDCGTFVTCVTISYIQWSAAVTLQRRAKWHPILQVCTTGKVFSAASHYTAKSTSVPTNDMLTAKEDMAMFMFDNTASMFSVTALR